MARGTGRHKIIEDDGISSNSDADSDDVDHSILEGDEAEEFALNDPYSRKRKRKTKERLKEEALYGDFLPDDDDRPAKRSNYLKTPIFVKSDAAKAAGDFDEDDKVDNLAFDQVNPAQEDQVEEKDDAESMDESSSEDEVKVPRVQEEVEPEPPRPSFGGGGIGSRPSLGGIGSKSALQPEPAPRQQKSFLGSQTNSPASTPRPNAKLSAQEKRHFAQLEQGGGIGFKLLSKMGWASGTGLGTTGEGRINPIESQKRPVGMGIGHGGFQEQTKSSKRERQRAAGEVEQEESDEDDSTPAARRRKQARNKQKALQNNGEKVDRREAWTKPSPAKRKARVEHRTYEEILAASTEGDVDASIGQIIDLTGSELPSLASSLSLNVPVPTSDTTRLPELRHNLRLIADTKQAEVNAHAKEGKTVQEKRRWIEGQQRKAAKAISIEAHRLERIRQILVITEDVELIAKSALKSRHTPAQLFEALTISLEALIHDFDIEFAAYSLDAITVAAIAPTMRAAWQAWDPLSQPELWTVELKRWRPALQSRSSPEQAANKESVIRAGEHGSHINGYQQIMSAYDALMWTYWLPKVRSAINNYWDATDPVPAVNLYSAWESVLPPFVRDNVLDQLILPKVHKTMNDWTPQSPTPLHTVVFPWLPYAGSRMIDILDEAKRRLKTWLKAWKPRDGVPQGFGIWRDAYEAREWDDLMLKQVLPRLGIMLRDKFIINPRDQSVDSLQKAMDWKAHLRSAMTDQLLAAEFFPKWLEALYIWLTASPNYEQVSQWYSWWKNWFAEDVLRLPGVKTGFARGLDLMNQALALGEDAPYRLPRPSLDFSETAQAPKEKRPKQIVTPHTEVTFRSIVEDMAAENNLLFVPTGRSHETSGQALFRVSGSIDSKGGLLVYLQDDIVWIQEGSNYVPVSIQSMIERSRR